MSFINQLTSFFISGPSRAFGGAEGQNLIQGYCTISEATKDTMKITQHPVQQGAMISDHAYKEPVSVTLTILFASGGGGGLLGALTNGLIGGETLKDVYNKLLQLQNPTAPSILTPFNVITPKRTYFNMLLQDLAVSTDKNTENVLAVTATFQEVILVQVGTTSVPASLLSNPSANSGVNASGNKSALATLFGAFK